MTPVYVFAAWTVFVWGTRIDNVVSDGGSAGALLVAAGMVLLAAGAGLATWRRHESVPTVVTALAAATVVIWMVRTPMILLDGDHGAGFKVVHAALAAVSVALALVAVRTVRSRSTAR